MQQKPKIITVDNHIAQSHIHIANALDHKYSRGVVSLITGSASYVGAGVLSIWAAHNSGAGLVRYCGGEDCVRQLCLTIAPETVCSAGRTHSWVVGCGVDTSKSQSADNGDIAVIQELLQRYNVRSEAYDVQAPPIVVDAGALALLPYHVDSRVIITPHYRECRQLIQRWKSDLYQSHIRTFSNMVKYSDVTDDVVQEFTADITDWNEDNIAQHADETAQWISRIFGCTTLLKGATTIIASGIPPYSRIVQKQQLEKMVSECMATRGDRVDAVPQGTPLDSYTNVSDADNDSCVFHVTNASFWASTAGSGDVLAGIIGALTAQQHDALTLQDEHYATIIAEIVASAAYIHGFASCIASNSTLNMQTLQYKHSTTSTTHNSAGNHICYDKNASAKFGDNYQADNWDNGRCTSTNDQLHKQWCADGHVRIGHPIVAQDIIKALPTAIELLLHNLES